MNDPTPKALLPAGLRDVLPPEAEHEAAVVVQLLEHCAGFGYERVKPPLIEFEELLLEGPGVAVAAHSFRLMDPVSRRMMVIRSDMTPHIARIAGSRLAKEPRPLRLCYAGDVLRATGTQLRPERQFGQVGCELIGSDAEAADVEVISLAASALKTAGVATLSIDLTSPTLVPLLCGAFALDGAAGSALRSALDRKDMAAVEAAAGRHAELFVTLMRAAGPATPALKALEELELSGEARIELERLAVVARDVMALDPALQVTVDPVENRGFEYHTGVGFTLFVPGVRGEMGGGGRYRVAGRGGTEEAATGFTLYMETLMRALPPPARRRRVYLPGDADPARAEALRRDGWVTVAALDAGEDPHAAARRQGCSHVLIDGTPRDVSG